jgi:hypothetical protein
MFSLAAMSVTTKVVGGLVILSLVVGPYLALRYYVPKYHEAVESLKVSKETAVELTNKVAALEKIKTACAAATEALETERKHADDRRRVAEAEAEVLATVKNKRIASLSAKLSLLQMKDKAKEPVNVEQECVDLKGIVDEYTTVPGVVPDSKPAG